MQTLDNKASDTLAKVSEYYGSPLKNFSPLPSSFSVGIEIEVQFKHYFPDLYKQYFKGKRWNDYSDSQKEEISSIISIEEKELKEKLHTLEKQGIKKGKDAYWEFALDPVFDLSLILKQVHLLHDIGVLPEGDHALHMTIGNMRKNPKAYWLLMIAELLFSSQKRMITGKCANNNKTYFRKGSSGLLEKRWRLIDCPVALEFRSLELTFATNPSITYEKLEIIANVLNDEAYGDSIISQCKKAIGIFQLPNKNWNNYMTNNDTWDKYYKHFEDIRTKVKF